MSAECCTSVFAQAPRTDPSLSRDCLPYALQASAVFACLRYSQFSMSSVTQFVVLSSAPYLSGGFLAGLVQEQSLSLQQLTVITNSASLQPGTAPQQAFEQGISVSHVPGHHTAVVLGLAAATLKAGAGLTVYEPATGTDSDAIGQLKKALLLAGFVDSTDGRLVDSAQGQLVCVSCLYLSVRYQPPLATWVSSEYFWRCCR